MASVMPIRGEVAGRDLGIVDYHEHLAFDAPEWLLREDRDFRLNDVEKSAEELETWMQAGGRTIIEMSAIDFGRNIHKVKRVSDLVPNVHIIVITGYNKPYYCDRSVWQTDESDLIRACVRDITEGIDGTGIKAGIMKGGTGYNTFTERDKKLLRIAAKVHLETGVPIITHTEAGTMGYEQVEYLTSFGVEPHRICLSHIDRNPDFWEHRRIAETGAYVGYDCPGKIKYGPDELRNTVLRRLIDAGLGTRILLGNDLGRPSYWRSYGGGPGLDFVLTKFIPRLRAEGFSPAAIDDLLIHNPRRFLTSEE
ncbi:MAG: phosphotriesterase-related protein [Candidatus Latescibacteria bacterium]|nr:phosphotriesterase-related protein [Candidatus Latescibacterota bacterium]